MPPFLCFYYKQTHCRPILFWHPNYLHWLVSYNNELSSLPNFENGSTISGKIFLLRVRKIYFFYFLIICLCVIDVGPEKKDCRAISLNVSIFQYFFICSIICSSGCCNIFETNHEFNFSYFLLIFVCLF